QCGRPAQPRRPRAGAGGGRPGLRRNRGGASVGTRRDRGCTGATRGMSTGEMAGRHVVVSAGPTYADIDPVRFLGNRSSGKMGFAIAAAAARRGARVTLVAGPVGLATPDATGGALRRIDVRSAAQMHAAVMGALPADAYIGAAAVADFTPLHVAPGKIKKSAGSEELILQLRRTRDILADLAVHPDRPGLLVGFAAETDDVER